MLDPKGNHVRHQQLHRALCVAAFLLSPVMAQDAQNRNSYVQTNLVSNVSGLATHTDPNLINGWGIDFLGTGPWWVNAAGTGLSLLYDGSGNPYPSGNQLIVTIPPPASGGASVPTGIISNSTSDFQISGHPSLFLFASARGTISGWYTGTNAVLAVTTTGASYLGLTIGQISGNNMLYAADFASGKVDVFDGSFHPVSLASGAFQDPMLPSGYAPFNVQNIGGSIFVMYAEVGSNGRNVAGPGLGYVDKYSSDGTLQLRLQHGNWMNSPWGIAMAPGFGFGALSGHLLVGQFGGGQIAAFDPNTGASTGLLMGTNGQPITISGLWGIRFGNGRLAGSPRALYFVAGIDNQAAGLFGTLTHP